MSNVTSTPPLAADERGDEISGAEPSSPRRCRPIQYGHWTFRKCPRPMIRNKVSAACAGSMSGLHSPARQSSVQCTLPAHRVPTGARTGAVYRKQRSEILKRLSACPHHGSPPSRCAHEHDGRSIISTLRLRFSASRRASERRCGRGEYVDRKARGSPLLPGAGVLLVPRRDSRLQWGVAYLHPVIDLASRHC